MIFYFTGTGNSKFIANKIGACLGEKTVDIGVASKNNEYSYDCSEEQNIGFVFPTYGFCMPSIVSEFITNMELDNLPESVYVFAVNNCGSAQGRALYDFNKKLMDKNITLNYCRSIVFPDNYIVMYNVPEDKELRKILRSANIKLANVINNVLRNKNSLELNRGVMTPIYKVMNLVFVKFLNGTKKFNVNNECVGCGMCADICNSQAIEIKEGKPV
ncbi:MAG: EFR1 family ferrodoxin, partial [Lachnospirales bacterium]